MKHGYSAYTDGCRCEVCRKAKADYMRTRRGAARVLAQKHTVGGDGRRSNRWNFRTPGATRYVAPSTAAAASTAPTHVWRLTAPT